MINRQMALNTTSDSLYQTLPCNSIKLAPYQRKCDLLRVNKYAENFNQDLFEAIHVSFRDNQYWVIDGQHRLMLAKKLGMKTIVCQVHYGMSYEEEAKLFDLYNGNESSKATTIHAKINARIEYGDPATMEIKNIVESTGFIFGLDNSKAINKIIATSTLTFIHKQIGCEGLRRVLFLIKQSWDGIYEAVDKCMLMGVYLFVKNYVNDFKDSDFINKMQKVHPRTILNEGKSNKKYSKAAYTPYGIEVLFQYNKGRIHKLQSKF